MSLANLPKAYEKVQNDLKDRNVLEALGHATILSDNFEQEWQKVFRENGYKHTEFFNGNIILNKDGVTTFSSLPELLSACYIYKYYSLLDEYHNVLMKIMKEKAPLNDKSSKERDNLYTEWAKEARDNKSGKVITYIDQSDLPSNDKEKLKEFATDYASWGGGNGRTVNRKDFSQSAAYKILNVSQSLSSMHDFYKYYKDKDLYSLTLDEVNKLIYAYQPNNDNESSKLLKGENTIFYGAPGTGKSYKVNRLIKERYPDYEASKGNDNVFRVTLYPEYSYSDFVGQLLPYADNDEKVSYKFIPGIFTNALARAKEKPDKDVYLVLEEMSRANVAAVFGDLFQLLDRKDGTSEYGINNSDIAKIVYDDPNHPVIIPSNMTIFGTVNTSDQNVFVMDTAFKRRFNWRYISTDDGADSDDFQQNNNPEINIGNNVKVSWKKLYQALNKFIVGPLGLSEDKQIGPYFIKFENSQEDNVRHLVKDKLLQYLWEDINSAATEMYSSKEGLFEKESVIPSFSSLYTRFEDGKQVFSNSFLDTLGEPHEENPVED